MNKTKYNLLTVEKGIIIHIVNNRRVMGAGIALSIKEKYPEHYKDYMTQTPLKLGELVVTKVSDDLIIVGMVAQDGYGRDGKDYIDYTALETCVKRINKRNTKNLPVFLTEDTGCGLAGGNKDKITTILEQLKNAIAVETLSKNPHTPGEMYTGIPTRIGTVAIPLAVVPPYRDIKFKDKKCFYTDCKNEELPKIVTDKINKENFTIITKADKWKAAFAGMRLCYIYLNNSLEYYYDQFGTGKSVVEDYIKYLLSHGTSVVLRINGIVEPFKMVANPDWDKSKNPIYQVFYDAVEKEIEPVRTKFNNLIMSNVQEQINDIVKMRAVATTEETIQYYTKCKNVTNINKVFTFYDELCRNSNIPALRHVKCRIPTDNAKFKVYYPLTDTIKEEMKIFVSIWADAYDIPVLLDGLKHFTSNMQKDALAEKNNSQKTHKNTLTGSELSTAITKAIAQDRHKVYEDFANVAEVYFIIQLYKYFIEKGLFTNEELIKEGYHMCKCNRPVNDNHMFCVHCGAENPNYTTTTTITTDFTVSDALIDENEDDITVKQPKVAKIGQDTYDYYINKYDKEYVTNSECTCQLSFKKVMKATYNKDYVTPKTVVTPKCANSNSNVLQGEQLSFFTKTYMTYSSKGLLPDATAVEKEKLPTLKECAKWAKEMKIEKEKLEAEKNSDEGSATIYLPREVQNLITLYFEAGCMGGSSASNTNHMNEILELASTYTMYKDAKGTHRVTFNTLEEAVAYFKH